MGRLQEMFAKKSKDVLNIYCTAGYPQLDSTVEVMKALQEAGADMIELGMPYSDPLADGPVIQESSRIALANGMSITILFGQLHEFRKQVTLPVVLMGYMNPVLQYGFERFCSDAASVGIDGLILPDLPLFEFETEYAAIIKRHGLDFIFLLTPETTEDRIRKIDGLCSGFIYAVSSSSTTGVPKKTGDLDAYLNRLKDMKLKNPVLVGFGISDNKGYEAACRFSNGGIIGSAYIKALKSSGGVRQLTKEFIKSIRP